MDRSIPVGPHWVPGTTVRTEPSPEINEPGNVSCPSCVSITLRIMPANPQIEGELPPPPRLPAFWAKTIIGSNGNEVPGIGVFHHCLNVGCVAEGLIAALPRVVRELLPPGAATLAALHDIGKITLGFQIKSPVWFRDAALAAQERLEAPFSVSDHALVSQVFLQHILKPYRAQLWAAAVGAHHGRPKARDARINTLEVMGQEFEAHRQTVAAEIVEIFGALPALPPAKSFGAVHSDLWLLAGLITVADWIGSNEAFFSPAHGEPTERSRHLAREALARIGWPGGSLRVLPFMETFGFQPNPLQSAVATTATAPGLILVEGPMGCGKTEAALCAAQRLIAAGYHHGIYFALPTQVTSNRIQRRLRTFLRTALQDPAQLRLAHANSWLEDDQDLRIDPSFKGGKPEDTDEAQASAREARSWFASAKHALLAPYGVGTIDQALHGVVAVKHFFVRRFALAGKIVILDEIHSYDVYTGTLVTALVRELINIGCSVIILSATLTAQRRRELLEIAGSTETPAPPAYPLVAVANAGAPARYLNPEWVETKRVQLRAEAISEIETIDELIARAEAGQHVLWIRNTVVEAQATFRSLRGSLREGDLPHGLLHSRFPFQRRADLEEVWLERLGRHRAASGRGSILIATQVVEQSVDIDLDFIVSDLAPTDMLLQRMGRLWRHERPARAASRPEFWVRLPDLNSSADAAALKRDLGRSARVYAPYVLLRTTEIWRPKSEINLPAEIRSLLEATYADPSPDEPEDWRELREELETEKRMLTSNAEAAMRVFGLPMLDPEDDRALTRRKGPPTVPVLLLRSLEQLPNHRWRLTSLDDSHTSQTVSDHEWHINSARFLHRWLVRVPRWQVPGDAPRPRWLTLHASGDAVVAIVRPEDGRLCFGDAVSSSSYHQDLGVFTESPVRTTPQTPTWNDDDEFDG